MPPGVLRDEHRKYWHQLAKTDEGAKKFHIKSLFSYTFDLAVFVTNIVIHLSNKAYLAFGFTVLFHVLSAFLISWLYKCNEEAIDEDNIAFQSNHNQRWIVFRKISQWLGVTPIFRILLNWSDLKVKHETIRLQRILRRDINCEEVAALVQNKKRKLVNVHFACMHAYFKTLPQCILQIYLSMDGRVPLIFCTITDVVRKTTIVWSTILAAKVTSDYTCARGQYLKTMLFQDYLVHGHGHNDGINEIRKWEFWTNMFWNLAVVGSRLYAIAYLLSLGGWWAQTQILFLFALNLIWIQVSPTNRPVYENPPSGKTTFSSNIVDRFIGVFCFHEIRPQIWNIVVHQLLYPMVFVALFGGNYVFLLDDYSSDDFNDTYSTNNHRCNFSSNSNATQIVHVLNSGWEPTLLKDLFSNLGLTIIFYVASALVTVLYVHITYKSCLHTKKDVSLHTHNTSLPLQVSFRFWKKFFEELVDNDADGNPAMAMKLLLLGVLDNTALHLGKYDLANENGIPALRTFLTCYLEDNGNNYRSIDPLPLENNPCQDSLAKLTQKLSQIKFKEAELVSVYFEKYFYDCLDEMTSYRIAQTEAILNGGSYWKRLLLLCSPEFVLNFYTSCASFLKNFWYSTEIQK